MEYFVYELYYYYMCTCIHTYVYSVFFFFIKHKKKEILKIQYLLINTKRVCYAHTGSKKRKKIQFEMKDRIFLYKRTL